MTLHRQQFVPKTRPNAIELLLTIGPAGYGATFWRTAGSCLPDDVELRAVRLPGRESRYDETPYVAVQDAADEIVDYLLTDSSVAGRPVTIAGLCSGAVIAFEVARELARRGATGLPHRLVLADRVHPSVQPVSDPLHPLASTELFEQLMAERLLPPDVIESHETFAIFESTWRADLQLVETYAYSPEPALTCPIAAIAATARQDGAKRWAAETVAAFHLVDIGSWSEPLSSASAENLAAWLVEAMDLPGNRG